MKSTVIGCLTLAGASLLAVSGAQAQTELPHPGDLVLRGGLANVRFDSGAAFTVAGAPSPGADLELSNETTVALELDYFVRPNISLSLTMGVPPETEAKGKGTLAPLGKLGAVRFGTAVAQAKYHFSGMGAFQPWVGAGVTRMIIFDTSDGAVQNLDVKDAWGAAVQVGGEYMLGPRWGVHGSVSRLFLDTEGTATLGPFPVSAEIDLDPTIIQGGLSVRF